MKIAFVFFFLLPLLLAGDIACLPKFRLGAISLRLSITLIRIEYFMTVLSLSSLWPSHISESSSDICLLPIFSMRKKVGKRRGKKRGFTRNGEEDEENGLSIFYPCIKEHFQVAPGIIALLQFCFVFTLPFESYSTAKSIKCFSHSCIINISTRSPILPIKSWHWQLQLLRNIAFIILNALGLYIFLLYYDNVAWASEDHSPRENIHKRISASSQKKQFIAGSPQNSDIQLRCNASSWLIAGIKIFLRKIFSNSWLLTPTSIAR